MTDVADKEGKAHTYRRYEEGADIDDWDLQEKIFKGDTSHKCPTYIHKTPPCQGSCPSGHEIRGWLAIARGMDKPPVEGMAWQEYAFNRMAEANPFPATMGRVCPAPCEDGCNRNELDDTVGINSVEQYVGDYANENNLKLPEAGKDTGKSVAIIGAGPGGLSAAYYLRRMGHAVTIFDSHSELGGMMRYGIPNYRTPREMLDSEINRIVDLGVTIKTNTTVGKDVSMEEIDKFDAIVWAIGAQKGRGLPTEGWEGTENCLSGVDFLDAFNEGWVVGTAKKVVVVGGGDTSVDVASVARRLGHITKVAEKDMADAKMLGYAAHDVAGNLRREGVDTVLTSLFPIEQMTAAEHEREDAKREGIDIKGGVMPVKVVKNDKGLAIALRVVDCVVDNKGIPTAVEGAKEYDIECDMVVSAIGQYGDMEDLEEGLDNGRGFINVDGFYHVKDKPKHFAIGDIVRPHLLTTAIGHASIAAESINDFLDNGKIDMRKRPKVDVHHFSLLNELHRRELDPVDVEDMKEEKLGTGDADWAVHNYEDRSTSKIIAHDELFLGHFQFEDRNKRDHVLVGADDVMGNFEERIKALPEERVQAEGERCMSCGMCFECDNCVIYCPQDAVFKVKKDKHAVGRYVDTDYGKCIGCHICADVCPTGYIEMGLGE
ncbi:MAG: NAD(P)-binding protein [Hyphomicrobiaceae bacterium]|nr:NAD(P)-binding protein [Hyphomicrobiaceae bacterium]